METVGAIDAKSRWSELLQRAEQGESFLIVKHGHPVARLVSVKEEKDLQRIAAAAAKLRSFRGLLKDMTLEELQADRHAGRLTAP